MHAGRCACNTVRFDESLEWTLTDEQITPHHYGPLRGHLCHRPTNTSNPTALDSAAEIHAGRPAWIGGRKTPTA